MSTAENPAQDKRQELASGNTPDGRTPPEIGAGRKPKWLKRSAYAAGAIGAVGISAAVTAQVISYVGPASTDPSHYTAPIVGTAGDAYLAALGPGNSGSLVGTGGVQLTKDEVILNGTPQTQLTSNSIPVGGKPSPTYGAQPWTQPLLMFEEFGPDKLDLNTAPPSTLVPLPTPVSAQVGPDGNALENFLAQTISPLPTKQANNLDQNPWVPEIDAFVGRKLVSAPAEGRPPGEGWAHQRWDEFTPKTYFKTAQASARTNNGFRNSKQMHGWSKGEFGPGGLYYRVGVDGKPGNAGIGVQFHPNFPIQRPEANAVWTFDGTMPPKLLMARYGEPTLMRHYNALPIDPSANKGFGLHTITTHEHNGHNPAESDGFANAFFFPGQFYDYRWPIQLAGYDTINTDASDARAGYPCAAGETLDMTIAGAKVTRTCDVSADPAKKFGNIKIRGDWRETMSTHWFHDHMLDFTSQNVYKGNAVMMNYYSKLDRGNESVNDGVNLRLPSGSALPWGNRDYDINLVIGDKAWGADGQLWFNPFQKNGFIGDQVLVNWAWRPNLDVRARRYRFRILDGGVARYLALGIVKECAGQTTCEFPGPAGSNKSYVRVPFHMIANDGNIMQHAIPFTGKVDLDNNGNADEHKGLLPVQGIAERYDIVVDFGATLKDATGKQLINPGDKLYVVNTLEHTTGEVIGKKIPLADIMSGRYKAVATDTNGDGVADKYVGGDPGVTSIMQMTVKPYVDPVTGKQLTDNSLNPVDYEPGKKHMIEMSISIDASSAPAGDLTKVAADRAAITNALHRSFTFGHSGGTDAEPWTIATNGGNGYNADMRRISAAPGLSYDPTAPVSSANVPGMAKMEVWKIILGGGWSHPVHIHFEEGVVLARGGKTPPLWEKWARKDVYRIGPDSDSRDSVELAIHFREFAGTFVEHCHNTTHEDNAMLLRWDIEHPGQFLTMPAPIPGWEGVNYAGAAALTTYRTGDGTKGPSVKTF